MGETVEIVEVGPRDGLQNETAVIGVPARAALVDLLSASGLRRIEIGAFVSPRWVPQMAGSADLMAAIAPAPGVSYPLLVPNLQGWERFAEARRGREAAFDEIAVFVSASEGFSRANLNCTIAESLARIAPVATAAQAAGVRMRGYVSCVTDCPYDGDIAPEAVARTVAALRRAGAFEVSLGDTIGRATPDRVDAMLGAVLNEAPASALAGHFHDTAGRALENVAVSIERGLRIFDSAVGGLGGCPYAPGAAGNLATESLLGWLVQMGHETGIEAGVIERAARKAQAMRAGEADVSDT